MGVVYRALQTSLQRTVALKMIPNAAFASTQDFARLRAEALAAARLSHPNIVPVYEVGEHHGQPWFSMKFIEGSTLSKRLMDGPMAPREAVAMLLPIVEAIGAAHRAGVLHRDVKPSNIMIAKRVSVADQSYSATGQPSELAGLTQSGAILGTPAWMSPEQAAGQTDSVDVATDVYSLGAVLFAMLTGRPPFQSASPLDTVLMVLEQDPPNIRMLNRGVDSDLEMVVMKCLQKPPDLRYASTVELADDLRAWLSGEPVSARSSTFAQIMMRLFRESHHAAILQNWGLLWMWHSLVVLCLCLITNYMQYRGVADRWLARGVFEDFRTRCAKVNLWIRRILKLLRNITVGLLSQLFGAGNCAFHSFSTGCQNQVGTEGSQNHAAFDGPATIDTFVDEDSGARIPE
jgi:serine/threonine-protein kinase